MSYCVYCGVELEENTVICPLCNSSVTEVTNDVRAREKEASAFPEENLLPDYEKLTRIQYRWLFWKLSALILLSGSLVTLTIDLLSSHGLTWSKYSVTTCLVLFINLSLISVWRQRLMVSLFISFLTFAVMLVLFDIFGMKSGWGKQLGIPLLLLIYSAAAVLTAMMKRLRNRGLNLIAYFIITTGLISAAIEGITDRFFSGRAELSWSFFVLLSVMPVAGILLYIHFKLKKGRDLKRFFHI